MSRTAVLRPLPPLMLAASCASRHAWVGDTSYKQATSLPLPGHRGRPEDAGESAAALRIPPAPAAAAPESRRLPADPAADALGDGEDKAGKYVEVAPPSKAKQKTKLMRITSRSKAFGRPPASAR